jgi:hypothetical protein
MSLIKIVNGQPVVMDEEEAAAIEAEWLAGANRVPSVEDHRRAVQAHIDATAQSKGYNDGAAMAGYVVSTIPTWRAEAETFVAWRDAVWLYVFELMAQVQAGDAEPPASTDALIGWLPQIEW